MKAKDYLTLEIEHNSWFHAYLLVGKDKGKIEEIINSIIDHKKCLEADISQIDPKGENGKAGEIKTEAVRELLHSINLSPLGLCRIAIIRDCQKLNRSSGNLLLKTLEEPPKYLTIILTAENNSVLETIKSRCRIIQVNSELNSKKPQYPEILSLSFKEASDGIVKIIDNNQTEAFLDELEEYFRDELLNKKTKKDASRIYEIERIRKEIRNNANPRLALESLYLLIKTTS